MTKKYKQTNKQKTKLQMKSTLKKKCFDFWFESAQPILTLQYALLFSSNGGGFVLSVPRKSMPPCSINRGFFSGLENANQFCKQEFIEISGCQLHWLFNDIIIVIQSCYNTCFQYSDFSLDSGRFSFWRPITFDRALWLLLSRLLEPSEEGTCSPPL